MFGISTGRVSGIMLLSWAAILGAVSPAVELKIEPLEAPSGKVADIGLALVDGQPVGALEATLTFDPGQLEYVETTAGPAAAQSLIQAHAAVPGRLRFAMVASDGMGSDGVVALVKFRVLAPDGTNVALGLEQAHAHHYEKLIELPISVTGGELKVTTVAATPDGHANLLNSVPREWLIGGAVVLGLLLLVIAFRAGRGSRKGE